MMPVGCRPRHFMACFARSPPDQEPAESREQVFTHSGSAGQFDGISQC
jgi:hypothetical protein